MLHKTKGIVLSHIKYGDSSVITTIYTETHGRKSFMVQGVYGKKNKFHPTFFQPLSVLDLEIYIQPNRNLHRIREISFAHTFHHISIDPSKSAITLFLSEILFKTLKEEEANRVLFDYLFHSIQLLDIIEKGIANFHIFFLLNLSKHLGFYPMDNYSELNSHFDNQSGHFIPSVSSNEHQNDRTMSSWIHQLLQLNFEQLDEIKMNHNVRNAILNCLITYYKYHINLNSEIKSLPILQNVFDEEN